jgi:hypothetical protein
VAAEAGSALHSDRCIDEDASMLRRPTVLEQIALTGCAAYVLVFALLLVFSRPGYGISQGFYVAIVLIAFASGPGIGGAAGALACGLYVAAYKLNSQPLLQPAVEIKLATYVATGVLVGFFARRGRSMLADSLHVLDELLVLARRDPATGAIDAPGLAGVLARRLADDPPLGILVGEIAPARAPLSDHVLRELTRKLRSHGVVGRIGPTQFAVMSESRSSAEAHALAAALERELDAAGFRGTFGWAFGPQEGRDPLALYAVATERLYARRHARGEWEPTAESAGLVTELRSGIA